MSIGCFCLLAAICSTAGGQNWPSFRGPRASGVGEGRPAPTRWDATELVNIKWKVAVPGLGHSSPVIWGNRIFLTTAVGGGSQVDVENYPMGDMNSSWDSSSHVWMVYCFDKSSGRLIWKRRAHKGIPRNKRHPLNSFATPTPAVDSKHVVAFFGSEGLYCFDLNGKLIWKQDLGILDTGYYADQKFKWAVASSPIIYRNLVIVQCDVYQKPFIAAYNLADGKLVWHAERRDDPSWSTPVIYENGQIAELVTCAPHHVRGYDPNTGAELWRLKWGMNIHTTAPITSVDFVFVSSGKGPTQPLYAIRPGARGDISLSEGQTFNEHIVWSRAKGGPITPTPILYQDYLYTLSDFGVLRAMNASNGALVYEQRLASTTFFASPVAVDGKLYFSSLDGDVYVVKAGPNFELLSTNSFGEACLATPAISNGNLFIRTNHHLYCVRA